MVAPCQLCGAIETDEAHAGRARHKNHVAIAPLVERGLVPLPYFVEQYACKIVSAFELHESEAKSYASGSANQSAWSSTPVRLCAIDLAEDLMGDLREKRSEGNRLVGQAIKEIAVLQQALAAARSCAKGVPWWHAWVRTSQLWPNAIEKILREGVSDRYRGIFWEVVL